MIRGYCCCLCGQALRLKKDHLSKPIQCPTCDGWGMVIPTRQFRAAPVIIQQTQKLEPPDNEKSDKSFVRAACAASGYVCLTVLILFGVFVALFHLSPEFQELVKQLAANRQGNEP